MKLKSLVVAVALVIASPAVGETLTNATVIALTGASIGDEAIIAKIKSSEGAYDLSTERMIELKQKGVSGPVIAAMISVMTPSATTAYAPESPDPSKPHPAGVYLLDAADAAPRMRRIDATVSNQAKTGGVLGFALTYGISSMSIKASIQNETARVKTSSGSPTFYFFFDESNPGLGTPVTAWAAGTAATVTSPGEFTLVRLMQKKDRREARVGSTNIGGTKTGVMDKDRISFDYQPVRPGVYRVTPLQALTLGEYGFIYSLAGGGSAGAMTARIFDFAVLPGAGSTAR